MTSGAGMGGHQALFDTERVPSRRRGGPDQPSLEHPSPHDIAEPGLVPVPGASDSPAPLHRAGDADPLGGTAVPDPVSAALRRRAGRGEPLPGGLAGPMGEHFGMDLSALRVHSDPEAGRIADSVQARAFTHGNDLYFAPGQFRPRDADGQRMLAHEVSHVAAQRSGRDRAAGGPLTVGRSDDPAEAAADRSADAAMTALRRVAVETAEDAPATDTPQHGGIIGGQVRRTVTRLAATHPLRRDDLLLGGHRRPQQQPKQNSMGSGTGAFSGTSKQTTDVEQVLSDSEGGSTGRHTETTRTGVGGAWHKGETDKNVRNGKSVRSTKTSHDHLAGAEAWVKTISEASDTQLLKAFQARARAGAFSKGSGSARIDRGQVGVGASGSYDAMIGGDTGTSGSVSVDTSELLPALEAAGAAYIKGGTGLDAAASVLARLWKLEFVATGKVSMFAGFEASASGRAFFNGIEGLGVEGKAGALAGARGEVAGLTTIILGPAELEAMVSAKGEAGAWAKASGKVAISLTGVEIKGKAEAFAGVKGTLSSSGTAKFRGKTIASAKGSLIVAAGVGGKVKGAFSMKAGKLKFDFSSYAAKVLGGGVKLKAEVDFEALGYAICTTIWEQYTNHVNKITEDAGYIPRDPLIDGEEAARVEQLGYDTYIHDFRAYAAEKFGGKGSTGLNRKRVQRILTERRGQLGTALTHVETDIGIDKAAREAFGPLLRGIVVQAGVIRGWDAVGGSGIGQAREDHARSTATDALRAALQAGAAKTRGGSTKTTGTNAPDFGAVNKVLSKNAAALIRTYGTDKAGADAAIAGVIEEVYRGFWSNVVVRGGKLSSAKVDLNAIEQADAEAEQERQVRARVGALGQLQSQCAAYAAKMAKSARKPIRKDQVAKIIAKCAGPLTGSGGGPVVDRVITDVVIRGLGASITTFIYSNGEIRAFTAADPAEVNKAYLADRDAKRRTALYDKAKRDFAAYVTEKTKSGEHGVKLARVQKIVDGVIKKVGDEHLGEADAALTSAAEDALGPMVNYVKVEQGTVVLVQSQTKTSKLKDDYTTEKKGRGRFLGEDNANERRYYVRKAVYEPLRSYAAEIIGDPRGVPTLRRLQQVVDDALGARRDVLGKADAREYLVQLIIDVFQGIVTISADDEGRLTRPGFDMTRLGELRDKQAGQASTRAALDTLRTPLRSYAAKTAKGRPTIDGLQSVINRVIGKLTGVDGGELDRILQMAVLEAFGTSRITSVQLSGGQVTALKLGR